MAIFNSRLRYALCAAIDLALQPAGQPIQCREIAARQAIPGPFLDQIMGSLKSAGIVRSLRGAGGGYTLALDAERITVGDVVRAMLRGDRLFAAAGSEPAAEITAPGAAWVVQELQDEVEQAMNSVLDGSTLADLARRKARLNEAQSLMAGI